MMEMATSWFNPEIRMAKITRRLTTELREVKSLPIEARMPMTTSATVARPNRGAR